MTETQSPSGLRRVWSQLQALILTTLAVLVISTALVVGIGRLLIPYADQLRPWLEQVMSERIGQSITLDRVEAHWPRLTPSLSLIGVQLDDGQGNRLEIDQARLEIHLPRLFDRQTNLVRLVLLGLELALGPDEQGRWGAELAAGAAVTGDAARGQLPLGDLLIREARVRVRVPGWDELLLHLDEGGVQRRGGQTLFYGGLALAPGAREQLDLRLLLDHPQGSWSGARGWLGIQELPLESWLPLAEPVAEPAASALNLMLWLEWNRDQARLRVDGEFGVQAAATEDPLQGHFLLERDAQGWQFELPQLDSGRNVLVRDLAVAMAGPLGAIAVERMELAGVHAGLDPWLNNRPWWPQQLEGRIVQLELGMDQQLSLHAASGSVAGLGFAFDDPLPSLRGLNLKFGLDGDRLLLEPGGSLDMRWRRVIRGEVVLDALSGQLVLAPGSLELRGLEIDSALAAARADGWIYLRRPRPFLDFLIEAERLGPMDPRPYLPHHNIPPVAMDWLDEALVYLEEASGLVNFHMRAGTLARDLRPGSYQAIVDFHGLDLDYWPDWPVARGLSGQAEFIGPRLTGRLHSANLGRLSLTAPLLEIADLIEPELLLQLEAEPMDAGDLAGTLADIPVAGWAAMLEPMSWSGPVSARTQVLLPFREMEGWTLEGELSLHDADVHLPAVGLAVSGLSGSLEYDRDGIPSTALNLAADDGTATIGLAADFSVPASLEVSARLNPVDLFPAASARYPGLADAVSGRSAWRYRLEGGGGSGLSMRLNGDLAGLGLALPAPLAKPAPQRWPAQLELSLGERDTELSFAIEGLGSGRLAIGPRDWGLDLGFGQLEPPPAGGPGLRVSGSMAELALGEWLRLLENATGQTGPSLMPEFLDVDLALDRLSLPGLNADSVRMVSRRRDDLWHTEVDSPQLAGELSVPVPIDSGRAIVADVRRLHLQRADPIEPDGDPEPRAPSTFSPLGLPPLSAVVEDLRWGDLSLGRVRVEVHPAEYGLELELIDVSGADLRLQGRGRWLERDGGGPVARFGGRLSTPRLAALLRSAGYEAGIEASRAQLDLDVEWPGAPWDFALSRLVGSLELGMSDGEIPEARPGAGRLLGLVSFTAIPRRLMLDFRDVFSPGMRFDEIAGKFELAGGFATTAGLVMRSTSAVITISGATDMVARQYDQEILVEPGLGATLPVIGGLAGGPVGAAAGLVLRQLLDRPLRGVAEVRYRVTGAWDAPEIELVAARVADEEPLVNGQPDPDTELTRPDHD